MRLSGLRERFPVGRKYLVAVSGGRDSVVLLELLVRLGYRKLVVCHVNHGLRGRVSGGDAAWVRRLAGRRGLECEVGKVDLRSAQGSVEAAAREARYGFFAEVSRRQRCRRVFLAHHADDQVETVLMNLCRGSGGSGMAGMREESLRGRLELLRPLLQVWGDELASYAEEVGVGWREDASNAGLEFTRNRVRHRLVPALREVFGRDVRAAVLRGAEIVGEEDRFLGEVAGQLLEASVRGEDLDVKATRAMAIALQRRVVAGWLRGLGVTNVGLGLVERVRGLCLEGETVARVNLPGGGWVRRRAGRLFLCP